MSDLIDRQAAKEAVRMVVKDLPTRTEINTLINELPSAMRKGKIMFKVPCGQDPYDSVGEYIREHITAIEDIIAVIEINGITTNELFMVDMQKDNYFIWNSDWWEGEENIVLLDFFPVSEAINPSTQQKPLKYSGDSICVYCKTADCDGCIYEPMEGVMNG